MVLILHAWNQVRFSTAVVTEDGGVGERGGIDFDQAQSFSAHQLLFLYLCSLKLFLKSFALSHDILGSLGHPCSTAI